ncbi:ROK family protein [Clostridium sp. BJN0001]|uniref:ROK family protein n=1 Tax=Clostridium sp. BJN0001 TaxID=2930219 RepID=UPI001FCFEA4F|nr:ROK family protein [Clostridium sp. BJN0001]
MQKYVIGIDLGGTKISTALSDLNGEIVSQTTVPTKADEGEIPVLNRIINSVSSVIEDSSADLSEIKAIGIGSPGPLDAEKGVIIYTPNLPFKDFNLVEPLKKKFNLPVFLDNDANVATIGEYMFGAGKGSKDVIFFTISTGVGGGAILNGKIYRGHTSNALEIGHMTIEQNGPRCNCGNIGCVEALASGTAIAKRAKEALESKAETSLRQYEKVTSAEVFEEAKKGDTIAKDIISSALNYLGIAVANAVTIFDPEVVIMGGGVTKAGDIVFDTVRKVVDKRCFKSMASSVKIVPAGLGQDAGVIGAVALALLETQDK